MPKIRPGWTGKYKLSKHEFYMVYHYALQYTDWLIQYNLLNSNIKGICYDREKVNASPALDVVEQIAVKRAELRNRMELIENTAKEADPDIYIWLLRAVTKEGVTFNSLKNPSHSADKPIPCEKDMYYDRRRKFYWLLAQRLA